MGSIENYTKKGHDLKKENGKEPQVVNVDLPFPEPDRKTLYGYGTPISVEAARLLIRNYWKYLSVQQSNEFAEEQKVAFTVGKEALFSILSQENCTGIRIYLGMKNENNCPLHDGKCENICLTCKKNDIGWDNGLTTILVGVSSDNGTEKELGSKKGENYIVKNLKIEEYKSEEIHNPIEFVPTKRLKEYKDKKREIPFNELDEVIAEFF